MCKTDSFISDDEMKEVVGISGDTCVVPPRWEKVPSKMAERTEWRVHYWKNLKIHFTFALRGKYGGLMPRTAVLR